MTNSEFEIKIEALLMQPIGSERQKLFEQIQDAHRTAVALEVVEVLEKLKHPWGDEDTVELVAIATINAFIAKYKEME